MMVSLPKPSKQQCLWVMLLGLASSSHAFSSSSFGHERIVTPPSLASHSHRAFLTRHHVGGKWQLPFTSEKSEDEKTTMRDVSSKTTDFEKPAPDSLFSSFFPQDALAEDPSREMGDLVELMNPAGTKEQGETSNNLMPVFLGAAALAMIAVGAGVAGMA